MSNFELHLNINTETTALQLLSQHCQLTTAQLKAAAQQGALWLEQLHSHTQKPTIKRFRRIKNTVKQGDILHLYFNEKILSQRPATAQLITDKSEYSIWYKPYGMLCQGSKWSDHCTINRWVETQLKRPTFIVHRLDKAASGLIILAHSKKMAQIFSKLFEQRNIEKTYQIICHGDHSSHPQPETVTLAIDNKNANSQFNLVEYNKEYDLSLLTVTIGSGRKHQIRKHAAAIKLPVVGDRLHGNHRKQYPEQLNLQLCAVKLQFTCPISQETKSYQLPSELTPSIERILPLLTQSNSIHSTR